MSDRTRHPDEKNEKRQTVSPPVPSATDDQKSPTREEDAVRGVTDAVYENAVEDAVKDVHG